MKPVFLNVIDLIRTPKERNSRKGAQKHFTGTSFTNLDSNPVLK